MPAPDLHVVCLDPPWPPVYGGAIDQYYGIEALVAQGVKPALHVFYRSDRQPPGPPPPAWGLKSVSTYRRSIRVDRLLGLRPFIVESRRVKGLLERLRADERPIWFQGVHTTGWAARLRTEQPRRRLVLRVHNIEADYYGALAEAEPQVLKRLYFQAESLRLRRYENKTWRHFDCLHCISQVEARILAEHGLLATWLPAFLANRPALPLPEWSTDSLPILFHADFRVQENRLAGQFLIDSLPLMPDGCRVTLAGRGLATWPVSARCQLVPDPPDMLPLLAAHPIVVLPLWRGTGVKLKLLESIASGRVVLATEAALRGSGFEERVPRFTGAVELAEQIHTLLRQPQAARMRAAANRDYFMEIYNRERQARQVLRELGLD
jgi:hypothetical protein